MLSLITLLFCFAFAQQVMCKEKNTVLHKSGEGSRLPYFSRFDQHCKKGNKVLKCVGKRFNTKQRHYASR